MKKLIIFTTLAFFCVTVFSQEILSLKVDYDLPLEIAVKKGKYDFVNEKAFSLNLTPPSDKGKKEIEVKLFYFEKIITSDEVIKKMEEESFRPAIWSEGLAFGQIYPKIQLQKPIIILGSVDDNKIIFLYETFKNKEKFKKDKNGIRAIAPTSWHNQWFPKEYFFLAVKKNKN